jgi:hypothetical protein
MRTKLTLTLSIDELSDEAKEILRQGFCIDDDENHLWCSIVDILDNADGHMPGLSDEYADGWDKNLTVKDLPKAWWDGMNFSPEMAKEMKKFWKKNPNGEIEWTW